VVRRSRQAAKRGRAVPDVPAWPLDPPRHQHELGPAPGATRPSVRTFFCRQCRHGVETSDPPDGWLRVQLRDAATQQRDGRTCLTVALFCGLPCLRAWAAATTEVTV
jgi:hypothetical protein